MFSSETVRTKGTRHAGTALTIRGVLVVLLLGALGVLAWQLAKPVDGRGFFGLYTARRFLLLLGASYAAAWGSYFLLNMKSAKENLLRCLLSTGALLFIVGMLELPAALAWVDYSKLAAPPDSVLFTRLKPWQQRTNRFDPELLFQHRPDVHFRGETPGDVVEWLRIATSRRYSVDIQYDRNGFRNDREFRQASIVAIGDSFVEAGLVSQPDVVTSRLSRIFETEVANLGHSGYSPQQELMVLRRYGLPLRPRVVLWFFFEGNDLLDVHRFERFKEDVAGNIGNSNRFRDRSLTKNALQTLEWLSIPRPVQDSPEAVRRSCRLRNGDGVKIYFAYAGVPLTDMDLAALRVVERTLLDAKRIALEGQTNLLMIYVPTKFRVYQDVCDFPADGYGRKWQPNDLSQRLEAWCRRNGVPFLDLTAVLKAAAARGELVYFPDDGHWNAQGHAVVADTIADYLRAAGWAPGPPSNPGATK